MRQRRQAVLRCPMILLLAGLLMMILLPATARAHGGGTAQITDAAAGPYRLFVWTSPDPWQANTDAHITIAVTTVDAAGQASPVTDAEVIVRLTTDTQPTHVVSLSSTPVGAAAAGFYDADGKLPADGLWQVEVQVTGNDGVGSVSFAQIVQPEGSSINWFIWGGGALALLTLVGFLATQRRHRAAFVTMRTPTSSPM